MKSFANQLLDNPSDEEFSMAPLIDCVFLLLIYFMTTTSLLRAEADLSIRLPATVQASSKLKMPDEQIIEVTGEGRVLLNGLTYAVGDQDGPPLLALLVRFRETADTSQNKAMVTIAGDDAAPQAAVIAVLDACAQAGISNVTFSM